MKHLSIAASLFLLIATDALAKAPPAASAETQQLIERLGLVEDTLPSRERPGWQPPKHVAVTAYGDEALQARLMAEASLVAGDAEVFVFNGDSLDQLQRADVLLGVCSPQILAAAPNLKWLHSFSVGVERCTLSDEIADYEFILTNNQRGMGPDIAEHTIALMLAVARNFDFWIREQHSGRWSRGERRAVNVNGKTMLVLGLGGIGTEIARRAHGLGMRVIATRNSSREGPDFVEIVGLTDETLKLAAQANVVANALPLTKETQGLIDQAFFDALPPGAIYLSVGRGGTTDTDALVQALKSGHLGGAGLDVTDPEPLPDGHALWAMENVVITPHVSAQTDEARERVVAIGIENLRRYTLGEPLLSVVDFELGY